MPSAHALQPNRRLAVRLASAALVLLALWLGLAHGLTAAPTAEQTRVFQQGLNGYTGVRDSWVSTLDWDTPKQYTVNYGQNTGLTLSRNDGENPLLRFDLSSIPANSAVLSATLSLYNTTQSSYSGTRHFARRMRLFAVLRDWDEGNQVESPINAAGKHGVTGDFAFSYFGGAGTNVPWSARGMAAGSDYRDTYESYADVVDPGWYSWDVTALVRSWVRGELPNFGLVLRDATGYADDHNDWRTFVSSQATSDSALRPKLTVVYNPDVPLANAGPDQQNLTWNGGPVTLDASASRDRPGGNNATLRYSWRIVQAAYGSAMTGTLPAPSGPTTSFRPNRAGEWDLELTVTNSVNQSATDRVHLRLLSIPAQHPRIYLNSARLTTLRARAVPSNARWSQLLDEANAPDGEMHAKALVSQITGQTSYCDQAISAALALAADPNDYSTRTGDIALVYDWCYGRLSSGQRQTLLNYFANWATALPKTNDSPGWGNYWPRWAYSYALAGLAAFGDTPQAAQWLDEFRYHRYRDTDLPLLNKIAAGGAWPEGMIYDWIANWPRVKTLDAWGTATGEDLFPSSAWYRNRLPYILLHRWPGTAEQWGSFFHPYLSTGDTERNRGSIANYERIMALILVAHFPYDLYAHQLQAYLSAAPFNNSQSFLYDEEFLWYNPDQPADPPGLLTQYAVGTGTAFMRSGWPSGAADTDTNVAYLTFQSGDHFTYHQHYDQNSFTLFKRADLLVDSGVYSGDGLSDHDINYYVRTIAHNTLVVYNPAEDFSSARPDAYSNDGGQRTMYPASRSPETIEYFTQYFTQYNTADVRRFESNQDYTYLLGDATRAYNGPAYNQAMDAGLPGNIAKVTRFQREFVYLRPTASGMPTGTVSGDHDYVVLYDRVGVTKPAFSGANTKLLFHTLNAPTVNGQATTVSPGEILHTGADQATVVSGPAKLFIKSLLPARRNMRVVGGRGVKSYWVFNRNYDWQWDASEPQPRPINDFEDVPYGEWRLELEPGDTALDHNFLTVLYPTISTTVSMPATAIVTGTGLSGVLIADPLVNRLTLFAAAANGTVPLGTLVYSYVPTTRTVNAVFDLVALARYNVTVSFANHVQTVTLAPNAAGAFQVSRQGVLRFILAPAGTPVAPACTSDAAAGETSAPQEGDDGSESSDPAAACTGFLPLLVSGGDTGGSASDVAAEPQP